MKRRFHGRAQNQEMGFSKTKKNCNSLRGQVNLVGGGNRCAI